MVSNAPAPSTLRRSCQACARSKRRCDQRWPKCSRCLTRKIDCEYANEPLTVQTGRRPSTKPINGHSYARYSAPWVEPLLQLEIAKEFDPSVIAFLVDKMRQLPLAFAQHNKTLFIHPGLYQRSEPPAAIKDIYDLCRLYDQANQTNNAHVVAPLLQFKSADLLRQITRAATFEQMLASTQALLLAQCMLLLNEGTASQSSYSESTSSMLIALTQRLWHQAPIQLPHTLSPRRAWLYAESVRRTIIMGLVLRSTYSLKMRRHSVRTPFVDALPFDLRTDLWDEEDPGVWETIGTGSYMISLHEYSDMMESGRVHGIGQFGSLILSACKGISASSVPFPSEVEYGVSYA